ncbi:MAG TPA: hypothetical protein ENH82_10920 [bacterium]|nr:hypothetical protein [bacterium]
MTNQRTYIYLTENSSIARGKNRNICVYRIKKNKPVYLGDRDVNTASYEGDRAREGCRIASEIISEIDHIKMDQSGYFITGNNDLISI